MEKMKTEEPVEVLGFRPVENIRFGDLLRRIIHCRMEYERDRDEKSMKRLFESVDMLYLLQNGNRLPPGMTDAALEGTMMQAHPEGRTTRYIHEEDRDIIIVEHMPHSR